MFVGPNSFNHQCTHLFVEKTNHSSVYLRKGQRAGYPSGTHMNYLTGPRVLTTPDENATIKCPLLHHSSRWSMGDGVYRGIIYFSPLVFVLFGGGGGMLFDKGLMTRGGF